MDNLNIHSTSALYETFPPQKAFSLASRLEFHFTPQPGRWLDIAEIELSALGRQYLGSRRIPDLETLRNELRPWCKDRNNKQRNVDWQFTTDDAGTKLKNLYPILSF